MTSLIENTFEYNMANIVKNFQVKFKGGAISLIKDSTKISRFTY